MFFYEQWKMAKSITKKELIEFEIDKIKRFTDNELKELSKSPLPFCYQLSDNTLIVGSYKVVKVDDKCWSVYNSSLVEFEFFSRKDAIFYCIAMHNKKYKLASDIRLADSQVAVLEFDATLYRYRYRVAVEKNNSWDIVLYSNKYTEIMAKLEQAKKRLQKSLSMAKYIKG